MPLGSLAVLRKPAAPGPGVSEFPPGRGPAALVLDAVPRMSDFQVVMEQARAALADRPLIVLVLTYVSMWTFARLGAWLATRRLVDLELEGRSVFGVVSTATLTLLALIIATAVGSYLQECIPSGSPATKTFPQSAHRRASRS